MPIENDSKENDIEPPKPVMTYDQYVRLVQLREERQHEKYLKMFSDLEEQIRKNHEKAQRYHEEAERYQEETQRYREETQREFNKRMDALIKDTESYLAKPTEQPAPSLIKDNEHGSEMRQLKAQVAELKAENEDLRNKIYQLWELITSFCRSKITSVPKGFNSFFSKGRNPSSPEPSIEVHDNSNRSSF
jgi:cell division septum initiation protein DivIVA